METRSFAAHLGNVGDDLVHDAEGGEAGGVAHLPPDLVGERVPLVDVEADAFPQHEVQAGRVREAHHGLHDKARALVRRSHAVEAQRVVQGGVPVGHSPDVALEVANDGQVEEFTAVFLRQDGVGSENGYFTRFRVAWERIDRRYKLARMTSRNKCNVIKSVQGIHLHQLKHLIFTRG